MMVNSRNHIMFGSVSSWFYRWVRVRVRVGVRVGVRVMRDVARDSRAC